MEWQPLNILSITTLSKDFFTQFKELLEEKEHQACQIFLNAVQTHQPELFPPFSSSGGSLHKMSEALDIFSHRIQAIHSSPSIPSPSLDFQPTSSQINTGLWNYLEWMEGAAIELFSQAEQIGCDDWKAELVDGLTEISHILQQNLTDLAYVIKHAVSLLKDYRLFCQSQNKALTCWRKWRINRKPVLDNNLLVNVQKTQKFLSFKLQQFTHRFEQYLQMSESVKLNVKKFDHYQVLATLSAPDQKIYQHIYRLMKIWKLNLSRKAIPNKELAYSLKKTLRGDQVYQVLQSYKKALKKSLFSLSRSIKKTGSEHVFEKKEKCREAVSKELVEIHTLGSAASRYRDFLLRADSNPYVRSRWGFSEWIVGVEPPIAHDLRNLGFEIESLNELYKSLQKSLEPKLDQPPSLYMLNRDIQRTLHEMGQPLMTHFMMKTRAEHFLSLLQKLDVLGSCNPAVVTISLNGLSRALRTDWRYQVLQDIPLFHKLYDIHQGVAGNITSRSHENRMQKFQVMTHDIAEWMKKQESQKHRREIDDDLQDMKGYLQDFYAEVQRASQQMRLTPQEEDAKTIEDFKEQLLEYRYHFSNFFHFLRNRGKEEKLIREQFLFVDQYFEAIESKLNEMQTT